jgi:hypothetical protein
MAAIHVALIILEASISLDGTQISFAKLLSAPDLSDVWGLTSS